MNFNLILIFTASLLTLVLMGYRANKKAKEIRHTGRAVEIEKYYFQRDVFLICAFLVSIIFILNL